MSGEQLTIDVDIGGTFTDCLVRRGDEISTGKAETTDYDLSIGFLEAVDRAAVDFELDGEDLIDDAGMVRYSTTVALNNLIQREGTRLGLITTEGYEDTIYVGRSSQWADGLTVEEQRNVARAEKPEPIIPHELAVGAKERLDADGEVLRPLDETDLREKVQSLIDAGVRAFVVALNWSFRNPMHEQRVREIIREEYPDSYLGSAPVFLSSEASKRRGEYERSMTTILNAYLHRSMVHELYGLTDKFRDMGYDRPLMMIHNSGGSAEVFRTTAIDTFNSGPVAAHIGTSYLADQYGFESVVAADMGGTSFDLSLVGQESTRSYDLNPVVDRWRVHTTMLETKSIGAGGGSIAGVNRDLDDQLEVGPESAGSNPGPACYNQGGRKPTVTDADVVLGYINPENFHGGEKALDVRRAERAIRRDVANPLDIDTVEAAALIREVTDAKMGSTIYKETALRGHDPREAVVFAFGGAGPTHAPGFARHAGVDTIISFPYSSVFSAFGSNIMDTMHIYEYSVNLALIDPADQAPLDDFDAFNDTVADLRAEALRDLRGEGFDADEVVFELELDMKYGGQIDTLRARSPIVTIDSADDVQAIKDAFERAYEVTYSPISKMPETGVEIENFVLKATAPREKPELPTYPTAGEDPTAAHAGDREVYWIVEGDYVDTVIYDRTALDPGNVVDGPAIIEADNTTIAVPPDGDYRIDEHRIGVMALGSTVRA